VKAVRPAGILGAAIIIALGVTVALAVTTGTSGAGPAGIGATGVASTRSSEAGTASPAIQAVAAENQYGSVVAQVGGRYVRVTSLLSNPTTDPHTFEASPQVAHTITDASLVVQNGLGYDSFMNTIEGVSPGRDRQVITVQRLLGLPDSTPNPHLWYSPGTMPAVARAVAADLAVIDPAHAAYYQANASKFTRGLGPWYSDLASLKAGYPGVPVATTEPVADYLLQAAGAVNATPWAFQADVMNGLDPSPQDVAAERGLLSGRKVRALIYNVQVTDPLTQSLIALARASGVPVVGVYETMPQPGFDYQSWMAAESDALKNAISARTSTEHL
jgi:zinc/manganese transport system substrate-binding protein